VNNALLSVVMGLLFAKLWSLFSTEGASDGSTCHTNLKRLLAVI